MESILAFLVDNDLVFSRFFGESAVPNKGELEEDIKVKHKDRPHFGEHYACEEDVLGFYESWAKFSSIAAKVKIDPRIGPIQGVQPKPKAAPTSNGNVMLLLY